MKRLDFSNGGQYLFEYEDENYDFLKKIKVDSWLAWSVIKRPLFYILIQKENEGSSTFSKNEWKIVKRVTATLEFFWRLMVILFKRKPTSITFSHDQYKIEKTAEGKRINYITDPLIINGLLGNNLNIGISDKGNFKSNALIKDDLLEDGLFLPIAMYKRLLLIQRKFRSVSIHIADNLNFFLKKKVQTSVHAHEIEEILVNFLAEYEVHLRLFKLLKPRIIFFVDSLGTGRLAAAKKLGIKTVELQHGLIDKYKPDYAIPIKFKTQKSIMPVADLIGTFGNYFSKIILESGFWNRNEVISIGNYRVSKYRNMLRSGKGHGDISILFPTQWHVFNQSKKLIRQFIKIAESYPSTAFTFHIKPHPRESGEALDWYSKLTDVHPELFVLNKADDGIYDLLLTADLCIGFDTTVLLEALALSVPTVTIATEELNYGIHSFLPDEILKRGIYTYYIIQIPDFFDSFLKDKGFVDAWRKEINQLKGYLYDDQYMKSLYFEDYAE